MNLLSVDPGLIFWTIVNFLVFLFIIIKFGAKPITQGLKNREERIQANIDNAENANAEARKLLEESQAKLDDAQKEMAGIIAKGRQQAEALIQKAGEEADKVKKAKLDEAVREIERNKDAALQELRTEVAGMVIAATEKILDEKLDDEKHQKLIESYIEKLPKN